MVLFLEMVQNKVILVLKFKDMQIYIHVNMELFFIFNIFFLLDDYLNLLNYPLFYQFSATYNTLPHEYTEPN